MFTHENPFNIGEKVKVTSECMTKGRVGKVKDLWFDMVIVEFDGKDSAGLRNKTCTFSYRSLTKENNNTKKSQSSEDRIAVFLEDGNLDFEIMECCDFYMVMASSPKEAVEILNKSDYNDIEFEKLLFDGKFYDLKQFTGLMISGEENVGKVESGC